MMSPKDHILYGCPNWEHTSGYLHVAGSKNRSIEPGTRHCRTWIDNNAELAELPDGVYCAACIRNPDKYGPPMSLDAATISDWFGTAADESPQASGWSDIGHLVETITARPETTSHQHLDAIPRHYVHYDNPADQVLTDIVQVAYPDGIYPQQASAIAAVRKHVDVLLATNTGSGKTLSMTLPLLVSATEGHRSIICVPRNVLPKQFISQLSRFASRVDEINPWLHELHVGAGVVRVGEFTGNTGRGTKNKEQIRAEIRNTAHILITNEHMVDQHFLSRKTDGKETRSERWRPFLSEVKHIVIDEVDCSAGHQRTQMTWVFRALVDVVTEWSGVGPQVTLASATTTADAYELITGRTGRYETITGSTGQDERDVVVLDASHDGAAGDFESALELSIQTLIDLTMANNGTPPMTAMFATTPAQCRKIRDRMQHAFRSEGLGHLCSTINVYIGPTSREIRNDIEHGVAHWQNRITIANDALGIGADLGNLEVSIIVGCPASMSKMVQWSGRVGRRSPGLVIVVADNSPIGRLLCGSERPHDTITSATGSKWLTVAEHCSDLYLRRLHNVLGAIPRRSVNALPSWVTEYLTSGTGLYRSSNNMLKPSEPDVSERHLLSDNWEYVTEGDEKISLSPSVGAKCNIAGAELEIDNRHFRVTRTSRNGRRKQYVLHIEKIDEPEGYDCRVTHKPEEITAETTTVHDRFTITSGIGTVRTSYRSQWGYAPDTTVMNASVVFVNAHRPETTNAAICDEINQLMFGLEIPPTDIRIENLGDSICVFDTNDHGRIAHIIAQCMTTNHTSRKAA